ncbi:glutaredoxin-related protein [Cricetibacter osteomyelitidis]|uniref:Glutaredoxin-related protein n=1 Tax=Cricetibacter osteomyelitidis TaxID=1521931 RepID=A0A4R2SVK6_9PAST|nr:hypothetical protein [Cricetibacter osteomyelitidis]TCP93325.1 glutaredoxin-related protein [Cricetibacter osteomyelitidis]
MTKPVLYFSDKCPDTPPFVAKLAELNIEYEAANISDYMPNLKRFLAIRDNAPAFAERKAKGYIGIPALVLESGEIIFEPNELERIFS